MHKPAPSRGALFMRSFKKRFPVAVKGEGAWLWDESGKRYLDLAGSAAVNFIGHGVAEIGQAMAAQAARLEFAHSSLFGYRLGNANRKAISPLYDLCHRHEVSFSR